jgi:hypothetical protein
MLPYLIYEIRINILMVFYARMPFEKIRFARKNEGLKLVHNYCLEGFAILQKLETCQDSVTEELAGLKIQLSGLQIPLNGAV